MIVEPNSLTWQAVEAEAAKIVASATVQICQQAATERETDFDRGQIAAANRILKLARPAALQQFIGPAHGGY